MTNSIGPAEGRAMRTSDWEALLDGTTPGPWETHPELSKAIVNLDMKFGVLMVLDEGSPGPENGRLAAAAPEAVAEVIRLRRRLERMRENYELIATHADHPQALGVVHQINDDLTSILEGDNHD